MKTVICVHHNSILTCLAINFILHLYARSHRPLHDNMHCIQQVIPSKKVGLFYHSNIKICHL